MKTSLMDYSIISPGPACMAPKSLGMVQQLELTLGIKLFSNLSKQETEVRAGIFHNVLALQLKCSTKHWQTVFRGV